MVTLHHGDCLEFMRGMADNSVDAVVTDPPYGLRFMGKHWDYDVPSVDIWRECLRVLKPGGHLLSFAGTRTQHRMAVRIEDAGFEIRDMIAWVYGSGFPKSLDVSKAIDKAAGAEREVVGEYSAAKQKGSVNWDGADRTGGRGSGFGEVATITAPATDAAREWQGWGTALKPALEPITVARKPLEGTVAQNVTQWRTGAINVDACRVATDEALQGSTVKTDLRGGNYGNGHKPRIDMPPYSQHAAGRWPANLIHDGSDEVVGLFPMTTSTRSARGGVRDSGVSFSNQELTRNGFSGHGGAVNYEAGYNDTGSAARFFYCAKASKRDRDEGLEGMEAKTKKVPVIASQDRAAAQYDSEDGKQVSYARNHHPTVKPTELMRYLCRLVTPPAGIVFDPFMGSGSTGKGAKLEGFSFIGCEISQEYFEIAKRRIEAAQMQPALIQEK